MPRLSTTLAVAVALLSARAAYAEALASCTTKVVGSYSDSSAISLSTKCTVRDCTTTAIVRITVELVDKDGFALKRITFPLMQAVEGETVFTSTRHDMPPHLYQRLASYRLAEVKKLDAIPPYHIVSIRTRHLGLGQGDARNEKVGVQGTFSIDVMEPEYVALQGLDSDGFEVCNVVVLKEYASSWAIDNGQLVVNGNSFSSVFYYDYEKVATWRTVPVEPDSHGLNAFPSSLQ